MTRAKFETFAGSPTRGLTYSQLCEKLIEVQELMLMMGHLHQTEDTDHDRWLAHGWRGMAELMERIRTQVIQLAASKLQ